MSGQDYVTMSMVIPFSNDLLEFYSADNGETGMVYFFKTNLYDSLKKRIGNVEDELVCQIACILDPRNKSKLFSSPAKMFQARENVVKEALKLNEEISDQPEENVDTANEVKQKEPKTQMTKNSLMSRIEEKLAKIRNVEKPNNSNLKDSIELQLRKYLNDDLEDFKTTDPVKFWFTVGRREYPLLFELAIDYLPIPATSVSLIIYTLLYTNQKVNK